MRNEEVPSRKTPGNLFTREFILIFFAFFSFIAANHALIPTLPIYLSKIRFNDREIGMLVGIMGVAALFARFLAGGVLIRHSEKFVMVTGALLFVFTFPGLMMFTDLWLLSGMRIIQGIAMAFFHTASLSYIIKIVPIDKRGQSIAYFMLAPNLAMAIVAPSSLMLINSYGFTIFFLSCTALSLCSPLFLWKIQGSTGMSVTESNTSSCGFMPEWRIAVPAAANFMQMFLFGGLTAFLPLYALDCGVANPGHFFTANAVVMIAGRTMAGKILDTYNKEKMILTFISISMLALIILSFSRNLTMFILVGVLWGTGAAFFMPACMSYALEYAGTSSGAAVGTYQAFMDMGIAVGPVVAGLIIPITGYSAMWLCLAALAALNFCYFKLYVMKKNRLKDTISLQTGGTK